MKKNAKKSHDTASLRIYDHFAFTCVFAEIFTEGERSQRGRVHKGGSQGVTEGVTDGGQQIINIYYLE